MFFEQKMRRAAQLALILLLSIFLGGCYLDAPDPTEGPDSLKVIKTDSGYYYQINSTKIKNNIKKRNKNLVVKHPP